MIQFFRDPARVVPEQENVVVCPADGRIVVVEKTIDPFRQQEALKISVFMNVFNVHSNRCPLEGTVQKVEYFAGSFLNAALDKASEQNERNAVLLKTEDGQEITLFRLQDWCAPNFMLCQGRRCFNAWRALWFYSLWFKSGCLSACRCCSQGHDWG